MAGKATKTPTSYSPSLTTNKIKGPCFNENWIRPDGRGLHQCRPSFFRTGTVNCASGSEFGNTKVIASVFGPRESKKAMMYSNIGRLNCNVSYATFATLDREQVISQLSFHVLAGLALADAGIMMNLVIDPNLEEENCQDGSLMISCMPSRCEVTQLTVTGYWSTPTLDEGMRLCLDACAELAKIMRSCLRDAASASQE